MNGYLTESTLTRDAAGRHLDLATALGATPYGLVENPVFFTGFVTRPDVAACGLLAVADVAGTRYADVGLAKRLANLDPVVTAGGDRLRFESFSACNGVHARFDLLPEGLGSSEVGFGTTNVDVNQPLRTALAQVGSGEAMHLSVGADELRASTLSHGTHVERKVDLPDRWVRGLAEVPALTAGMSLQGELRGHAITKFLAGLPRVEPPGPTLHVRPMPGGWMTGQRAVAGTFPIPGATRLRGAERILRFAERIRAYAGPSGSTAWVVDVPGGRFMLALSPNPFRGFSGEGTLLTLLSDDAAEANGRRLLDEIGWDATIDADDLARRTGLSTTATASGLAWLSASGRLGYDVVDEAWFHRELPIEAEKILRRNPRLTSAQRIVESGKVQRKMDGWTVEGTNDHYDVRTDADRGLICSCPWEHEHAGSRGPCKHVLAVVIQMRS